METKKGTPPMPPKAPTPPKDIIEIEIFSEDQLNILPQIAKDSIVNLADNLPVKELRILNPLITELLKIKELTKIKYVPLPENPTKEDIAAHKENIEEFKEAKRSIVALGKKNSETKSAIKKPLDELGKHVLTIEKQVKIIANEIIETLEKEFKPYIDAEQSKKDAAAKVKSDKEKEAINNLTAENSIQMNTINKSSLITFIKYQMLENKKAEINNAIENYALDSLFLVRDSLSLKTFEQYTVGKELSLLNETELSEIKSHFEKEIISLKNNINLKIKSLELEEENKLLSVNVEAEEEEIYKIPIPIPVPIPQATSIPLPNNQMVSQPPNATLIANSDVFGMIETKTNIPFGGGANAQNMKVVLYPENHNEVSFIDLVLEQISNSKNNVEYILNRFIEDEKIIKSLSDIESIRRVTGAVQLFNKITDYVLNKIPTPNNQ